MRSHSGASERKEVHSLVGKGMKEVESPDDEIGVSENKEHGVSGIGIRGFAKAINAPGHRDGPAFHRHVSHEKVVFRESVKEKR